MDSLTGITTPPTEQPAPYSVRVHAQTRETRAARLQCPHWWQRQLTRRGRQQREFLKLASRTIGIYAYRYAGPQAVTENRDRRRPPQRYASDQAVTEDRERRTRTLEWATRQAIQGPNGERRSLLPLLEAATERRYAELVAWSRGLDDYATASGLVPVLVTLTLPGEWHPNPSQGRKAWNRKDPKQAAAELTRLGGNLQRDMRRYLTRYYAQRVREPQGDGTPHDHLVTYVYPEEVETLRNLVHEHFGPKPGGDVEPITKGRGSTYACKYIAKHTYGIDQDKDGEPSPTEAVRAWRSTWGIRAFAFLGLPRGARTLYRTLRRLPDDLDHPQDHGLQQAARAGRVRDFLELYDSAAPSLLTKEQTDRYGDTHTRVTGIITSDNKTLELPRYEIVAAEDETHPPSYDEWAKAVDPWPHDGPVHPFDDPPW